VATTSCPPEIPFFRGRLGAFPFPLQRLLLLEHHVAILNRVEYLATQLALDELGVFITCDDADLRVFAMDGSGVHWRNGKILPRSGRAVNGLLMNFALL
jgi:hypothetical protein